MRNNNQIRKKWGGAGVFVPVSQELLQSVFFKPQLVLHGNPQIPACSCAPRQVERFINSINFGGHLPSEETLQVTRVPFLRPCAHLVGINCVCTFIQRNNPKQNTCAGLKRGREGGTPTAPHICVCVCERGCSRAQFGSVVPLEFGWTVCPIWCRSQTRVFPPPAYQDLSSSAWSCSGIRRLEWLSVFPDKLAGLSSVKLQSWSAAEPLQEQLQESGKSNTGIPAE